MSLDYQANVERVKQALLTVHDPNIAKVRAEFLEAENRFFREHIRDRRVLIGGAGLGHDVIELAKYNKRVVGVEVVDEFVRYAKDKVKGLNNVEIHKGDMRELFYDDDSFDASVLNLGTITGLSEKGRIIDELVRVSGKAYIDIYLDDENSINRRIKMYQEEGWKNVRYEGGAIVGEGVLYSKAILLDDFSKITKHEVRYHPLTDFAVMTEITKVL